MQSACDLVLRIMGVQVTGTFCIFRESEAQEVDSLLESKQLSLINLDDLATMHTTNASTES